jgi:DNA-binding XRE family transcriptional regulator
MTNAGTLTDWPTNHELIAEQLRADPEFRAEWERTAGARALAVAIVRYRAERDLSPEELAGLVGMTTTQIANLEAGDANPSADTLTAVWHSLESSRTRHSKRVGPRRRDPG